MKSPRLATLTKEVRGRVIVWKKGTKVRAKFEKATGWCLELVHQKQPLVRLANNIVAVPRSCFEFDK